MRGIRLKKKPQTSCFSGMSKSAYNFWILIEKNNRNDSEGIPNQERAHTR